MVSENFTLEYGIPQGIVLNVTLFALAIQQTAWEIHITDFSSNSLDDFLIYLESKTSATGERLFQNAKTHLELWCKTPGFMFFSEKMKRILCL